MIFKLNINKSVIARLTAIVIVELNHYQLTHYLYHQTYLFAALNSHDGVQQTGETSILLIPKLGENAAKLVKCARRFKY